MAIYTDFDLKMVQNPYTKDVRRLEDSHTIKASIRNIIMTNRYERRFNLFFGGNVRNYLFETLDLLELETIKEDIISKITRYEPRLSSIKILSAKSGDNDISFRVEYIIKNETVPNTLDVIIYRNR